MTWAAFAVGYFMIGVILTILVGVDGYTNEEDAEFLGFVVIFWPFLIIIAAIDIVKCIVTFVGMIPIAVYSLLSRMFNDRTVR